MKQVLRLGHIHRTKVYYLEIYEHFRLLQNPLAIFGVSK